MVHRHEWKMLIPKPSELEADQNTKVSYFVDILTASVLKRSVICSCGKTGHKINSRVGGVRIHSTDYFFNEAKRLSEKYGFKING